MSNLPDIEPRFGSIGTGRRSGLPVEPCAQRCALPNPNRPSTWR